MRCGPGRRCAPSASPLRAGPNRVVLTPVAGVKGWSACTPTGRRKQPVQTSGLPNSSVPTVTNPSVAIATGESTKQAGSLTACGTPDVSVLSWFLTHALFAYAHEAADASCVRRSARPRLWRGEGAGSPFASSPSASPRRANNRGDDACPLPAGMKESRHGRDRLSFWPRFRHNRCSV